MTSLRISNKYKWQLDWTQLVAQLNLFILGFLFVELVVATPVERRTFVSVACTAEKSKPAPISFQNIRVM